MIACRTRRSTARRQAAPAPPAARVSTPFQADAGSTGVSESSGRRALLFALDVSRWSRSFTARQITPPYGRAGPESRSAILPRGPAQLPRVFPTRSSGSCRVAPARSRRPRSARRRMSIQMAPVGQLVTPPRFRDDGDTFAGVALVDAERGHASRPHLRGRLFHHRFDVSRSSGAAPTMIIFSGGAGATAM